MQSGYGLHLHTIPFTNVISVASSMHSLAIRSFLSCVVSCGALGAHGIRYFGGAGTAAISDSVPPVPKYAIPLYLPES